MPLTFSNKTQTTTPSYGDALRKKLEEQQSPLYLSKVFNYGAPLSIPNAPAIPTRSTVASSAPAPVAPIQRSAAIATPSAYTPPAAPAPVAPMAPVSTPVSSSRRSRNRTRTEAPPPNFAGILAALMERTQKGDESVNKAREDLAAFRGATADKVAAIRSTPVALEFQQGRAQAVQQASAEKEKALEANLSNALTSRAQDLSALEGAAGLASPVQVPYSNQFVDPVTGKPSGGGSLGASLTDAASNVAEKVKSGTMGYDAGIDALSGYGQAGVNELQRILGPNFNVQQSNALAAAQEASTLQTGTIGGQLEKGAQTVKQHMTTLENLYSQIASQSKFPIANRGINFVLEQLGSGPLQAYNIALQNVRDELAKILGGGTSTDGSRATARELLPDNMTPDQLSSSIATATELMNSKIAEYTRAPDLSGTNPASAPAGGSTGGSGGLYDW